MLAARLTSTHKKLVHHYDIIFNSIIACDSVYEKKRKKLCCDRVQSNPSGVVNHGLNVV